MALSTLPPVVVVASRHRRPLALDWLGEVAHQVSWTPDEDLPVGFTPGRQARVAYIRSHLGAYRCYRGHQRALSLVSADTVLVLEDDAVPNRGDWQGVISTAASLLARYEVVSLHGRDIRHIEHEFSVGGLRFCTVAVRRRRRLLHTAALRWCQGSLAYLIRHQAARRLIDRPYDGLPVDLVLANDFSFAVSVESPFDHDRREGSLVEQPR